MILLLPGLRRQQFIVDRTISIIKSNLDILDEFVARHSDIMVWHRPTACTHSLLRLKSWLLKFPGGGASAFCEVLVKEAEVLLAPANMFGMNDEYVRVGFGRINMPEALLALEDFLEKFKPM